MRSLHKLFNIYFICIAHKINVKIRSVKNILYYLTRIMFGWGSPAAKPNAKRGYFSMPQMPQLSNPFARSLPVVQQPLMQGNPVEDYYSQPVVQQPIAIPVPVQVPVARNSTTKNSRKFYRVLSDYDELEDDRRMAAVTLYTRKRTLNNMKKTDSPFIAEAEANLKEATDKVEAFLKKIPPSSIDYKNSDGDTLLSIASDNASAIGIKTLCEMGANTNNINEDGQNLPEVAARGAKKLGAAVDTTEFMAAVKQCTALKGGRRSVRGTKKVRRKRRYASRRR